MENECVFGRLRPLLTSSTNAFLVGVRIGLNVFIDRNCANDEQDLVVENAPGCHQGGHKPGKHEKPGKLREFEKLSKSQGKLREI